MYMWSFTKSLGSVPQRSAPIPNVDTWVKPFPFERHAPHPPTWTQSLNSQWYKLLPYVSSHDSTPRSLLQRNLISHKLPLWGTKNPYLPSMSSITHNATIYAKQKQLLCERHYDNQPALFYTFSCRVIWETFIYMSCIKKTFSSSSPYLHFFLLFLLLVTIREF